MVMMSPVEMLNITTDDDMNRLVIGGARKDCGGVEDRMSKRGGFRVQP